MHVLIIRTIADWPGFGEEWFQPGCIANILSLALVKEMFHITYASTSQDCCLPSFLSTKKVLAYVPMALSYVMRNIYLTRSRDNMLAMPPRWNHASQKPGQSDNVQIITLPVFQYTCISRLVSKMLTNISGC